MLLQVTVDKTHHLPAESAGGVEVSARGGKIRVASTLESRLDLISSQVCYELLYENAGFECFFVQSCSVRHL